MAVVREPSAAGGGLQAQPEVGYRAKYEEMRAHMRERERKANAAAAEELGKLKASQMSDIERAKKQYEAEKAASIPDAYGEKGSGKSQADPVVLGDGKRAEAGRPAGDFARQQFLNMHR